MKNNQNYWNIQGEKRKIIVSVSPQAVASLAVHYNLSIEEINKKLAAFLRSKGVNIMMDTNLARTIALRQTKREFSDALKQHENENTSPNFIRDESIPKLPILSSACPGIIQ